MTEPRRSRAAVFPLAALAVAGTLALAPPAAEAQRREIGNDMAACSGSGAALRVVVNGIETGTGRVRVQSYRATPADWMQKGKWLTRQELAARRGVMTFCVPLPGPGSYGIAVRHDVNGNGKTDFMSDGGGVSNNPAVNIFNLGKPSARSAAVSVGNEPRTITINMRYM